MKEASDGHRWRRSETPESKLCSFCWVQGAAVQGTVDLSVSRSLLEEVLFQETLSHLTVTLAISMVGLPGLSSSAVGS